jgi:arabinan endo-1,5-alpha-L-arabinosidase
VEPELATNCCAGSYRSTIDPDVTQDASGQKYILFGSFTGGIFVRKLSADGFTSDPSSEQQIAANTRYEGANWWIHNGYYYLFASSASCCNGPLSGYGVFVGRATSPMGPFLDAQGVSMTEASAGGTPVLRMNGNSVIGPGGNVIFTDEAGKDYILYHGIVDSHPYYGSSSSYNARPSYIEVIDWVNGWPITRGGFGPSDVAAPQPLPAAQPGGTNRYTAVFATQDQPRSAIAALSDEFNTASLNSQWSYVHSMPAYTMTGSAYQVPTVGFDTTNAMASVPMLAESSPSGDYLVETGLDMSLPVSGSGINYAQAGLLIYGNDNNYLRLDLYAKDETRQIEFIKGETPVSSGYPSWGGTSLGSPAIATDVFAWLRIAKRIVNGEEHYTAYSSSDGANWIQGGTWVHTLGSNAKICLYAGNRTGFTATFDYVHVSTVQ